MVADEETLIFQWNSRYWTYMLVRLIGIFTFDLGPFYTSRSRSCTFRLPICYRGVAEDCTKNLEYESHESMTYLAAHLANRRRSWGPNAETNKFIFIFFFGENCLENLCRDFPLWCFLSFNFLFYSIDLMLRRMWLTLYYWGVPSVHHNGTIANCSNNCSR